MNFSTHGHDNTISAVLIQHRTLFGVQPNDQLSKTSITQYVSVVLMSIALVAAMINQETDIDKSGYVNRVSTKLDHRLF